MQMLDETWTNFRDSINSDLTRQSYEYCLNRFLLHCDLDLESLLKLEPQKITNLIIKYICELRLSFQKQIKDSRFDRLTLIAKTQFVDQHLERIDQLELINSEFWKLYREEKNTFKKAQILEKIAELQTFISPYYQASKRIMEDSINETKKDRSISAV